MSLGLYAPKRKSKIHGGRRHPGQIVPSAYSNNTKASFPLIPTRNPISAALGDTVADFGSLEGGAHNGLWCWCLSGERVLINTDDPSMRKPQEGEIAVIFIWSNCNGIHSENERAVAIGKLPSERKAAYDAILTVRENVTPLLRPGVRCAAHPRMGWDRALRYPRHHAAGP
jgi:Xaa-Pro dipeptidase